MRSTHQHRHLLTGLITFSMLGSALLATGAAQAASEVNLYTTREPKLIQPLLDAFEKDSGIKVNTVFVKDGLLERVKAEGKSSKADVLMTVDIGNLIDLSDNGITQSIQSSVLNAAIPEHLRDPNGKWYALSLRDRVLYVDKNTTLTSFQYEQLADPKWNNKVCIRSGQHPYNIGLIAAMLEHNGEKATEQWLRQVKANLARKATGGDRDVARDILGGICELGLANAYYAGYMKNAPEGSEARKWGDAIRVIRPTFAKSQGTHVNISGASVAAYAPNKDNAVTLLNYLVSKPAQERYAQLNYEYPVVKGVNINATMASFGDLNVDQLNLATIAKHRKQASELVDKVGFDQ